MNINSKTKLMCLLGHPISQSFSPTIHNYLFKKYNINNAYMCFDVERNNISNCALSIKTLGIHGANVTVPYKVDIIEHLDYVEDKSKLIGAINTIKNDRGILKGYNTDGVGFVKSIKDSGYILKDKKVVILGSGGACRSIAIELAENEVSSIHIKNRSSNNSKEIVNIININYSTNASYSNLQLSEVELNSYDILINTTPIGMESSICPIDESIIPNKNLLVCDIVYKPNETQLLKWALKWNLDVVYGIDMLINQGLEAFYIWTGIMPNVEDAIAIKNIYRTQNK